MSVCQFVCFPLFINSSRSADLHEAFSPSPEVVLPLRRQGGSPGSPYLQDPSGVSSFRGLHADPGPIHMNLSLFKREALVKAAPNLCCLKKMDSNGLQYQPIQVHRREHSRMYLHDTPKRFHGHSESNTVSDRAASIVYTIPRRAVIITALTLF